MKDTTFQMRWGFFTIGVILGLPSMLLLLFTKEETRDKFYSLLAGALISMLINLVVLSYLKPV
jgi:hypothetical protein